MVPMNTWKRAKLQPREKTNQKTQIQKNKQDILKKHTITWESPDGKTTRQIDYLAINHRYRNSVRKAYAVQGWQANMAQQHKVVQMEIRLNLMKHYKEYKPPDTGKHIQYDLTKLRADPQKIDRWMTQRNELPEHINHKTTAEEDWEKIKTPIQQAIQTVYPKKHPSQDKQSPEWAEKAKQWSTPQEWDTMQELIKERENKQKRIQGLDHKIKHQLKQIK